MKNTDTTLSLLTPPGTGAIAVIEALGAGTWAILRKHFRTAKGQPLPEKPELHRVWFGHLQDEVLLSVKELTPQLRLEVHCHGGQQVVRNIMALLGGVQAPTEYSAMEAALIHAPTLRCANILLDQFHGAFRDSIQHIICDGESARPRLARLAVLAPVGRHLVQPWKVVLAGAPNVGKSSLINALAGFQRSVVAPIPGTTRDVVTTSVAFDGWPVELSDTAGLREGETNLERAGIVLTKQKLVAADLVVWVLDCTATENSTPPENIANPVIVIANKCDVQRSCRPEPNLYVSAQTGEGLQHLMSMVLNKLIPTFPQPGEGVPYTPELAKGVAEANAKSTMAEAVEVLKQTLRAAKER